MGFTEIDRDVVLSPSDIFLGDHLSDKFFVFTDLDRILTE
jgi:hypothetical protein